MNALINLFTSLFNSQLSKNLINHWTGGGIIIAVSALAQAGIIPTNTINLVTGMNTKQVLPWLIFAVGIWLVTHLHIVTFFKWLFNRKLNKINQQLAIDKLKLQDTQVTTEMNELLAESNYSKKDINNNASK